MALWLVRAGKYEAHERTIALLTERRGALIEAAAASQLGVESRA